MNEYDQAEDDYEEPACQTLACSACRMKLVDLWVTDPYAIDPDTGKPFEWVIKARCPCGDESFPIEITGSFRPDGHARQNSDEVDDFTRKTFIEYPDINGKEITFVVQKV